MNKRLAILFALFSMIRPVQAADFACADPDVVYDFPRDHGAHRAFRIEWWYYTGRLRSEDGREFGFQWTLFRTALSPEKRDNSKDPFASEQVYMAHAAVSSVTDRAFVFAERRSRGYFGEAHAAETDLDLKIHDWSAFRTGQSHRIVAKGEGFEYELTLTPQKPLVLHGQNGVSRKGAGPCDASHYFSYTRLAASGRLSYRDQELKVAGTAWMDHEYSTSQLAKETVGWDWFSLQFGDGTELMLYRLRTESGASSPFSSATLVDMNGRTTTFGNEDFSIAKKSSYHSAKTKITYPNAWRIEIPKAAIRLDVETRFDGQELVTNESTGVTYYEGLIRVGGVKGGEEINGDGYVELSGYGGDLKGKI